MSIYTGILGKGPTFPIDLKEVNGNKTWGTIDGEMELLQQDIVSLMAHSLGIRVRQEELGHRLEELLEEPNNTVLVHLAKSFCIEYINRAEFRIKPLEEKDIKVLVSPTTISITIHVKLLGLAAETDVQFDINR
jgi:phage baseplate assembly protein W